MVSPVFSPSGEQSSWIEGRILVSRVRGMWNIEQHRRANAEVAPLVAELEARGAWASLVVMEDTLLTSLEVLEAGRAAVASGALVHLRALAWVIGEEIEGRSVLTPRYRHLYDGVLPSAVFETVEDGAAWLRAQLAAAGDA